MSDAGYKKNVGFIGSVSLLVTSITGPGIVLIPGMFQDAGWFLPLIAFVMIGLLAGLACLFVIEACSRFPGNEKFQRNVEFTVLIHQFYGRYWYYAMICILYGSLQSTNVASLIGSAQIFDSLLIQFFGATCGFGLSPINGLYCVKTIGNTNSPFGDNYMLFTFGLVIILAMIIPLTMIDLNDNMIFQLISLVFNVVFLLTVAGLSLSNGIKPSRLPLIGSNTASIIGNVLFNFAMANEIPSWVNVKHPRVDIHRSIWASLGFAGVFYVGTGLFGALGYDLNGSTNLLQAMYSGAASTPANGWVTFIYFLFPFLTYITSIPIAMIVVQLNFIAAKLCSKGMAFFWAVLFPFAIAVPFQTGSWVNVFGIWTSVTFQSICNFFVPFLIYLYMAKRNMSLQQSVIDELEFLDITAGIKKVIREDEDDFDYIYHLPYADPSRIIKRDPFANKKSQSRAELANAQSMSKLASASHHSMQQIRSILSDTGPAINQYQKAVVQAVNKSTLSLRPSGSRVSMIQGSAYLGSQMAMNSMVGTSARLGSQAPSQLSATNTGSSAEDRKRRAMAMYHGGGHNSGGTNMFRGNGDNRSNRSSARSYSRVSPTTDDGYSGGDIGEDNDPLNNLRRGSKFIPEGMRESNEFDFIQFKALPRWITNYCHSRYVALASLLIMVGAVLQVAISNAA